MLETPPRRSLALHCLEAKGRDSIKESGVSLHLALPSPHVGALLWCTGKSPTKQRSSHRVEVRAS